MPPFLIGPCMFLAPLVVVLVPIMIILWPPVLVLIGVAWMLLWPIAAGAAAGTRRRRLHTWLGESFLTLLTPWTYFDPPKGKAPPKAE